MAKEYKQEALSNFQRMAREREWWRDMLWKSRGWDSSDFMISERLRVLYSISRNEYQWQLLIVSAAYVSLRQPQVIKIRPGSDLYVIASTLASASRYDWLPEFKEMASTVSNLPLSALVKHAARLANNLRDNKSISAEAVDCIGLCAYLHPENGPDFIQCVREC
ncbi:hypothetical protein [Paraburkholderia phenazinium]|jgi:hypothetical protein|uniref:hypothetical protein n=1 Tax=Paraburkholderia phenazinium TaxID=60549 RepID=UPI000940EAEE|nr:hypothetical protein [Paraburkholderia phenazinium]